MSIRLKISYEHEGELAGVIRLLSPVIKSWKTSDDIKRLMLNSNT